MNDNITNKNEIAVALKFLRLLGTDEQILEWHISRKNGGWNGRYKYLNYLSVLNFAELMISNPTAKLLDLDKFDFVKQNIIFFNKNFQNTNNHAGYLRLQRQTLERLSLIVSDIDTEIEPKFLFELQVAVEELLTIHSKQVLKEMHKINSEIGWSEPFSLFNNISYTDFVSILETVESKEHKILSNHSKYERLVYSFESFFKESRTYNPDSPLNKLQRRGRAQVISHFEKIISEFKK